MKSPGKSSQNFSVFHTFSPCFLCKTSTKKPQQSAAHKERSRNISAAVQMAAENWMGRPVGLSKHQCAAQYFGARANLPFRAAAVTCSRAQHSHGCLCRARQGKPAAPPQDTAGAHNWEGWSVYPKQICAARESAGESSAPLPRKCSKPKSGTPTIVSTALRCPENRSGLR